MYTLLAGLDFYGKSIIAMRTLPESRLPLSEILCESQSLQRTPEDFLMYPISNSTYN
jgi:hypothetical protein